MADPIRYVKDIGLFTFSRGRHTCRWQTPWCKRYCYNKKFYARNPRLPEADASYEDYWQKTSAEAFAKAIPEVGRFRFATRGEIWTCLGDVLKVRKIMLARSDVLFWIVTRAWQPMSMMENIEELILPLPNARVLASMDPSTTLRHEWVRQQHGWSTVFAGDNTNRDQRLLFASRENLDKEREKRTAHHFVCPKTWEHKLGHCAICEKGCFSAERVDVHLKRHR